MFRSAVKLITPWRLIMAAFLATGAVLVFFRFTRGLGSVTNLSDQTPWGMWVGFDILAGIGLAAGGFVMAAAVYVFNLKRYRPMVRMAILTALLGYIIFIVGLILEVGRPWNMWRVITNPNIHSPLYEVSLCVMAYTLVLILEFSQVFFEKFGWDRLMAVFHRLSVMLVILGALISTLHQSTLGTLFTIAPSKMHPLWYSPLLPVHFFLSCIAAGLGMVCFESFLSERFLKHPPRMDLLARIARFMAVMLTVYFIFRIGDLAVRGVIGLAFTAGFAALLFWLENLLFAIFPIIMVFRQRLNIGRTALFVVSFSVVLGFIMHRFNVAITSFHLVKDAGYFPSWMEFVVTACLISAGFIAAGLAVRFLPVHGGETAKSKN